MSPCKPSAKYPLAINALANSSTRRLVLPKTIAKLGFCTSKNPINVSNFSFSLAIVAYSVISGLRSTSLIVLISL